MIKKFIEMRIYLEKETNSNDILQQIAEGLKDVIWNEEPLIDEITYEIKEAK